MRTILILLISYTLLSPSAFAQHHKRLTLVGHRTGIGGMDFSPDGRTLATGADSIRFWDALTLEHKWTLEGPGWNVTYSPDGRMLASGGYYGEIVHVWDALTGERKLKLEGHTDSVTSIAFSPDGLTIASGGGSDDNTIRLWDALTGEHIRTLNGHTRAVTGVAYHPDGRTLASGSGDATIRLWDAATGERLKTIDGHESAILSVEFSPDGRTLASGGWDQAIRLWDAVTGELKRTLEGHTDGVTCVAYGPDSRMLVSASVDKTVRHWNTLTGENKHTLKEPTFWMNKVAYSPDGRRFASGDNGGNIRLWNAVTGAPVAEVEGHTSWVYSVAFNPDGRTLVSGYSDGVIRVWDVLTGALIRTLNKWASPLSDMNCVAYSPDGRLFVSGQSNGNIRLWDAPSGTPVWTVDAHPFAVRSIAYSPDGRTIASGSYDFIRLWDAAKGKQVGTLKGHDRGVVSLAFSPDGRTLASGSNDATVRLWDLVTGVTTRMVQGRQVAYSPDGRMLATGSSDYSVRLWDALTGAPKLTMKGHRDSVNSVAFSPDGRTIASGTDYSVRLWDAVTGRNTRILEGHQSWVMSVAFSPDGRTLAAASLDGAVHLWELGAPRDRNATVNITPAAVRSPPIGGQFTLSLAIADGESIAGYQATVEFDASALRFVGSSHGDYLSGDAIAVPAVVSGNKVTLAAASASGESSGAGMLATLTFEVIAVKASTLGLVDVVLSGGAGRSHRPRVGEGQVMDPPPSRDLNEDGIVNLQDLWIVVGQFGQTGQIGADVNRDGTVQLGDLLLVAAEIQDAATVFPTSPDAVAMLHSTTVRQWLEQAMDLNLTDAVSRRGIRFLESLLPALTPEETVLLPNYPNPFNPETWIPYRLATDSEVRISIFDSKGILIRRFNPVHQLAGFYTDRAHAAYWDGRNKMSELVANGIYFYHFRAGDYTHVRKMVIVK